MLLPIYEYIHIPSDEDEAATFLSRLMEERPEIGSKVKGAQTVTGSARAVLEALVKDGTFAGRISDEEARSYDEEFHRYEAEQRETAESGA